VETLNDCGQDVSLAIASNLSGNLPLCVLERMQGWAPRMRRGQVER
jgi:hypothetical protein